MNKLPAHFCILPWVHVSVTPEGGLVPCSKHPNVPFGNLREDRLNDVWSGEKFEAFRKSMFEEKPAARCSFCTKLRDSGLEPYSVHENTNYLEAFVAQEWTRGGKLVGNAKPISLELRFSNVCNLRCRTCFPKFSTSWYPEAFEVYGESPKEPVKSFQNQEHFFSLLDECLDSLKTIQILGGEPLIQDEFYILLEKLIEAKRTDITIKVVSNFSRIEHKNWKFFDLAKQFPNFVLTASLDGVGPQAEYLRKGSRWEEIVQNFQTLKQAQNIKLNIYPVISVLNSFHITTAIERWIELGMLTERYPLSRILNFVTAKPVYYNIRILNEEERKRLHQHYVDFLVRRESTVSPAMHVQIKKYLFGILNFLNNGELLEHRNEFRRITRLLDKNRNENFSSLFPELDSLFSPLD